MPVCNILSLASAVWAVCYSHGALPVFIILGLQIPLKLQTRHPMQAYWSALALTLTTLCYPGPKLCQLVFSMACGILWFSISKSLWSTPELLPFRMIWAQTLRGGGEGELENLYMSVLVYIRIASAEVGQVIPVHTWHLQKERQNLAHFCWGRDPTAEVPHRLGVKSWWNPSPDNHFSLAYNPLSNFRGSFLHLICFVWCLHVFFNICTLSVVVSLWYIFHR